MNEKDDLASAVRLLARNVGRLVVAVQAPRRETIEEAYRAAVQVSRTVHRQAAALGVAGDDDPLDELLDDGS